MGELDQIIIRDVVFTGADGAMLLGCATIGAITVLVVVGTVGYIVGSKLTGFILDKKQEKKLRKEEA